MTVYIPFDNNDDLPEYSDSLPCLNAIVAENGVESIIILRDFNAHIGIIFGYKLFHFGSETDCISADVNTLGDNSGTFTVE